jgi:hypothetical protein
MAPQNNLPKQVAAIYYSEDAQHAALQTQYIDYSYQKILRIEFETRIGRTNCRHASFERMQLQ